MPLFGSSAPPPGPLAPAPHPIGVKPFYTQHGQEVSMRVRERKIAFSGDDFAVKDALTGAVLFNIEGKVMSFSGRKDVRDAEGKDLFTVRKKHFNWRPTYVGTAPQSDQELFKVVSRLTFLGTKLHISFKNVAGNGEEIGLTLRGDVFDRKGEITTEQGFPVARISRNFANAGQLFFDKQTYIVSVAPGVDISLMLAICVCLDEVANESKGNGGGC